MNDERTAQAIPGLRIVDLPAVPVTALDGLWQREEQWWRERFFWDISAGLEALRNVAARGHVPGKVAQVDGQTVGYTYYITIDRLGILAGLSVDPQWSNRLVGATLLNETITSLRHWGACRIESQCIAIDCAWLPTAFAQEGFATFWRQFLRLDLRAVPQAAAAPTPLPVVPWRSAAISAAAAIMQAAYSRGVDARMSMRYRSLEGCCVVLDQLLNQGGCGHLVTDASGLIYDKGQAIGFIIITELSPWQAHLAQVTVLPSYQGRGLGRFLLNYSLAQLLAQGFETLSLIVSDGNQRALSMYQTMGFVPVLTFPMFAWDQAGALV